VPIAEILNEGWALIQVRLDSRVRYYDDSSDEESDDEPEDAKAKVNAPVITLLALMH